MPLRMYLCPMSPVSRNGIDRQMPRVALYVAGPWNQAIVYSGPGKNACLCIFDTTDAEHAAASADPLIIAPPITPAVLDTALVDLPQAWQDAISARLTAWRVPIDWITAATTVRQLLRYLIRLFLVCRDGRLNGNFPEVDLAQTFNTLTAAQRNAIRNYAAAQGYSLADLPNTRPVREIVRALVERRADFNTPQTFVINTVEVII